MSDRKDWFFRQKVTQAELDEQSDELENADRAIVEDILGLGFLVSAPFPATVVENTIPDLFVFSNLFKGYDQLGRRLTNIRSGFQGGFDLGLPPQLVDMSVDEVAAGTAVGAPGNEKTLTVFIEFERKLTDPRTDGNAATVFFERDESIKFNVVQSAEAAAGTSVPPPLRADQLLLFDTVLLFGQTAIIDAGIDQTRLEAFLLKFDHGPTHTETGTDAIPNATTIEGGLLSAVDKTILDNTPQTVSDHAALFDNQVKLNTRPDIIAPSATTLDVTGSMVGKAAGGSASKEGVVTQGGAPDNIVLLRDTSFNELISAAGNRIFGRITVNNETTPTVWTLAFFTLIAGTETAFNMSPFSGNTLKWAVHEAFTLENLPTFDLETLFEQNLDAGDIVAASLGVAGKAKIASDGSTSAADTALATDDARTGAVKGRRNADAVTGFEQIIRLIEGAGITIALAQAAGEQQFTIAAIAAAAFASSLSIGTSVTSLNSGALGFTPIGAILINEDITQGSFVGHVALFRGSGAGDQRNLFIGALSGTLGIGGGVSGSSNWTCTQFTSGGVIVSGTNTLDVVMIVFGQ